MSDLSGKNKSVILSPSQETPRDGRGNPLWLPVDIDQRAATGGRPYQSQTYTTRDLFGREREIRILHGQEEYRLRITGNGKLILTK